jgi:hypothetical protein
MRHVLGTLLIELAALKRLRDLCCGGSGDQAAMLGESRVFRSRGNPHPRGFH